LFTAIENIIAKIVYFTQSKQAGQERRKVGAGITRQANLQNFGKAAP